MIMSIPEASVLVWRVFSSWARRSIPGLRYGWSSRAVSGKAQTPTCDASEKYPNAFKDALKYAYKYRKKDKNDTYVQKYEGFLIALKDSANKLAQYYIQQESFRTAASTYKYAVRFSPDDPLLQVLQGLAEIKARNVGEGERNLNLAMERIDESYLPDKEMLWVASSAMDEYAAYMDSKGDYSAKRKGQKLSEKLVQQTSAEPK